MQLFPVCTIIIDRVMRMCENLFSQQRGGDMTLTRRCEHCDGDGRIIRSRWGGNDPDTWDAGPCQECEGGLVAVMCEGLRCGEPAIEFVTFRGGEVEPYCASCAVQARIDAGMVG